MTVKFQVTVWGQVLDVEMTVDGDIDITNKNLEYEQTITALSGEPTPATYVYDKLIYEPIDFFIFHSSEIYANNMLLLLTFAVDCVEHVSYIYKEAIGDDFVTKVITEFRLNISERLYGSNRGFEATKAIRKILSEIEVRYRNLNFPRNHQTSGLVLFAANDAAIGLSEDFLSKYKTVNSVENSREFALQAASFRVTDDRESPEFKNARETEYNWQTRRLLHLMEAHQDGRSFLDIGKTS